jgi:hypothetical protein
MVACSLDRDAMSPMTIRLQMVQHGFFWFPNTTWFFSVNKTSLDRKAAESGYTNIPSPPALNSPLVL